MDQVAQYIVLITAYWLPIILVGAMLGLWNPLPHITYGPIVGEIDRLYRQLNVLEGHTWTEPFVRGIGKGSGELNWLLTTAGLMFDTLGLPHILMRFYTVPDVKQARMSVAWSRSPVYDTFNLVSSTFNYNGNLSRQKTL